ncbi:MAG: NAD-binding protein [Acidobacteriota bacterium]|nr:NAD-binding protein [Acidobacteriota bacterium]
MLLRSQKRLLLLLVALLVLLVASAFLYMVGMALLEGKSRGFWESLGFVGETLSTTGYGADARWTHPAMVVFVVVLQFLGVFLIFLIFPIYLIPFLEERFEVRLPRSAPAARGHVLVYRYGPPVATLLRLVRNAGLETVVVEPDSAQARRLVERGFAVVSGRLEDGVLEGAGLEHARALVANGADDENAAVILGARQSGFTGDVLAVVEEPYHRKPMMLAGATAVYTPRHILGAALAARASERISPRVEGAQLLGDRLVVSEVRIESHSELAGLTLAGSRLRERAGVNVIGQWVAGELVGHPTATTRLAPGGILLVAGSADSVHRLAQLGAGATPLRRSGAFLLAGYGEVGQKVAQLLRDAGEEVRVIDKKPGDGVDVVGDILDHRVLERADVRHAQGMILAVDSDSATLFATVILKDYAPEIQVIARVNEAQNVERIHRAGAEFALSLSEVSGQILAARLLGQEGISVGPQIRVLKASPAAFTGKNPAQLELRERTGVSIVAVERGERLRVELDPDFVFETGDVVYVCGNEQAIERFLGEFPEES